MDAITVLSLFDGIGCGQIALRRAGFQRFDYYASEIDETAIAITNSHFPTTIQLGDVKNVKPKTLPPIDLLMGGSPCQGFSSIGKGLNFNDPRSALFFEFTRILKESKPRYFLLENVPMKQSSEDIISEELGVQPIFINSSLVSAQSRTRAYWTNIPVPEMPKDKGIKLNDVIDPNLKSYKVPKNWQLRVPQNLPRYVDPYNKKEIKNQKSTALRTNVNNGNMWIRTPDGYRNLTVSECEKLQTMPEKYMDGVPEPKAKKLLGNGWTVDVIAHILKGIEK